MKQQITKSPYPYALVALTIAAWVAAQHSPHLIIPVLAIGAAYCGAGIQRRATSDR